jgi:hypothetical protein
VPGAGPHPDGDVGETGGPVPVDERVDEDEAAADRVHLADGDVEGQVLANPGEPLRVGGRPCSREQPLGAERVETEPAPAMFDVGVDLRLVPAEPVEVGPLRLERGVEPGQVHRRVEVHHRFHQVDRRGPRQRDGVDVVAAVEEQLLGGEGTEAVGHQSQRQRGMSFSGSGAHSADVGHQLRPPGLAEDAVIRFAGNGVRVPTVVVRIHDEPGRGQRLSHSRVPRGVLPHPVGDLHDGLRIAFGVPSVRGDGHALGTGKVDTGRFAAHASEPRPVCVGARPGPPHRSDAGCQR